MGLLPIMEKGKPTACHREWPLFYMNDFSRLGLRADCLEKALSALRSCGYTILEDEGGAAAAIDGREQLLGVFQALADHAIECETADLVSCAYQG